MEISTEVADALTKGDPMFRKGAEGGSGCLCGAPGHARIRQEEPKAPLRRAAARSQRRARLAGSGWVLDAAVAGMARP